MFEYFFKSDSVCLKKAAAEGLVIIVNISKYRSDAIIVRHLGPSVIVSLSIATH
jgi:hypothetical protein